MYKYLLCWRYLRTRKIALASIISVMLGVATMIVVNAVMAGFADKMRTRLKGVLSDVSIESADFDGFQHPEEIMALVDRVAGDKVEAMAPTLETMGMLTIVAPNGYKVDRPVQILGVRPKDRARVGDFADYLVDAAGKKIPPSLDVPPELRYDSDAGELLKTMDKNDPMYEATKAMVDEAVPDEGAIVGYALATHHLAEEHRDIYLAGPGARVILTFPSAGRKPEARQDSFTVVGFFKSGMSEYDSTHVYIPLERLQYLRTAGERVTHIQIKAKPGVDLDQLARTIQLELDRIRPIFFRVQTWEQKQGTILAAVALEQSLLNILLFLIIAVAGFGILAIFSMIVVEKTRDIGVLKALGASTSGVRGIFLGYGLSLGLVGSGVGMVGGLLFVRYINVIEGWLSKLTGRKVFDDTIYYFDSIPTLVEPWTVAWIVGGALLIAVAASVLPAQRAARLHPVQALRFE
jgi:lipoprotein-releasing system permease protein